MAKKRTSRRPSPREIAPTFDLSALEDQERVRATLVNGMTYSVRDFDNTDDIRAMIVFRQGQPRDISVRIARHLERSATDLRDRMAPDGREGFMVSEPVQKFVFGPATDPIPAPPDGAEEEEEAEAA